MVSLIILCSQITFGPILILRGGKQRSLQTKTVILLSWILEFLWFNGISLLKKIKD